MIAVAESNTGVSSGTTNYVETVLTADAQAGDVVVLVLTAASQALTSVAVTGGGGSFTEVVDLEHSTEAREIYVWWSVVVTPTATFRVTSQSTSIVRRLVVYRLSDAKTSAAVTGTPGTSETTGTSHAVATTPAVTGALLIGASYGTTGTYTLDAAWTLATGWTATTAGVVGHRLGTTAEAYTMTTGTAQTENVINVLVAIAPAVSFVPRLLLAQGMESMR